MNRWEAWRDQLVDLLNLPTLVERAEERIRGTLRTGLDNLATVVRASLNAPALATVTVLCEVEAHEPAGNQAHRMGFERVHWVPSVLGGEAFMLDGECHDLFISPQRRVRNFRWFVSGHPTIVCAAFMVSTASAPYGGTKYGEFEIECHPGQLIRVRLERKRVPS